MKVIAVLGPLGSGKTTAVNKLLVEQETRQLGKTLVVVNDVGTTNIDAARLSRAGDVIGLTAGCIGCSDVVEFVRVVQEAQLAGVETLVIEPTGIADGREIRDAVSRVTDSWNCFVLVDALHHERNAALGIVPTQLSVATMVGLSWWEQWGNITLTDNRLAKVLEDIGQYTAEAPVMLITSTGNLPELFWANLDKTYQAPIFQVMKPHRHGDHGVYTVSLHLRDDLTPEGLLTALVPHLPVLIRAKGVVAGQSFDFVQGSIAFGEASKATPHANFIATKPWEKNAFAHIAETTTEIQDKKKALFREWDAPLDDTIATIEWMLTQYPPVVASDSSIRVDCEADIANQMARRPGIPRELRARTQQAHSRWRLAALLALRARAWDKTSRLYGHYARRLGTSLTYHAATDPADILGEDLIQEINRLGTAREAMEGLLCLTELAVGDATGVEKPKVVKAVAIHGIRHQGLDCALAQQALEHVAALAAATRNDKLITDWRAVVEAVAAATKVKE